MFFVVRKVFGSTGPAIPLASIALGRRYATRVT